MTGPPLVQAAVDELYALPLAEFTTRRQALAAAARKSGDRGSATLIAGLRRPTRSADTLNRLVRTAPAEVETLLDLGRGLRAAERALDAAGLRELSARRRHLVSELARLAFDITDQPNPSASLRDEVTATLNAALADERVAELLISGSLVTQARWDGFGSADLPEAAAALSSADQQRPRQPSAASRPAAALPGKPADDVGPKAALTAGRHAAAAEAAAARTAAAEAAAAERAAAKSRAEAEQRRRSESAQREAVSAERAAREAQEAVSVIDRRISELSVQLAHQRELLSQAQKTLRSAETRRRIAQLALTRADGPPTG